MGVVVAVLLATVPLALPGATADTAGAKVAAEAWYDVPPTCTTPVGCGVSSGTLPAPRPAVEQTLHVESVGGVERARTYLAFDFDEVPGGATLTGGKLILPVAAAADGSVNVEDARLQVCLVNDAFDEVYGSFDEPPGVDCSVSVEAQYVPGTPAVFTVDLAAFADAWAALDVYAVAVLPLPEPAADAPAWEVAFSGRARTGEGVVPITVAVEYEPAPQEEEEEEGDDEDEPTDFDEVAAPDEPFEDFPGAPTVYGSFDPTDVTTPAAALIERTEVAAGAPIGDVSDAASGYAYQIVWLLPLALLALARHLAATLVRPMTAAPRPRT